MNVKKFRFPYFYAIIVLFVIAGLVALNIVKEKFIDYLKDYEDTQPKYVAEEIFRYYYDERDFSRLISISENSISPAETTIDLVRFFNELTNGKEITYHRARSKSGDDTLCFTVKADGKKFSSFTIKQSGKLSKYEFPEYELDTVENINPPRLSVTVSAPDDAAVYINDYTLNSTHCIKSEIKTASCDFMPEGVKGITYSTYKIDGLMYKPEIYVRNENGESTITYDEENDIYTAAIIYSEKLKSEQSDYVVEAAKRCAEYMEFDGKFSDAAKYFLKGTRLYESLRTSQTQFAIIHSDYRFDDVRASEFYQYDENTFSCRVQFTHVLIKRGKEDFKDYIDVTYFLKKVDGKYLIYDSFNR